MIIYDTNDQILEFWTTLGSINRMLISFESTAKSLQVKEGEDSPYVMDQDGNVFLRSELEKQGELTADDIDEDDYDYEYVIEEEN